MSARTNAGRRRRTCHQQGFTLVEVLIALVVLAIGMLGIAALYIEGLRASRTALARSEAVVLATDLADRIRTNPEGGSAYAGAAAGAPNANCLPGGAGCTPQELAAHDLRVWLDALAAGLPAGTGTVNFLDVSPTDGIPAAYDITVSWTEAGLGDLDYSIRVEI